MRKFADFFPSIYTYSVNASLIQCLSVNQQISEFYFIAGSLECHYKKFNEAINHYQNAISLYQTEISVLMNMKVANNNTEEWKIYDARVVDYVIFYFTKLSKIALALFLIAKCYEYKTDIPDALKTIKFLFF